MVAGVDHRVRLGGDDALEILRCRPCGALVGAALRRGRRMFRVIQYSTAIPPMMAPSTSATKTAAPVHFFCDSDLM